MRNREITFINGNYFTPPFCSTTELIISPWTTIECGIRNARKWQRKFMFDKIFVQQFISYQYIKLK